MKNSYKSPGVAVNWIITKRNKILLLKRNIEPYKDCWEIGGGLVEYGEKIEDAVIRELKEETGLDAIPQEILGVYSRPGADPRGHVVAICFVVKVIDGELKINDEVKEFKWMQLKDINMNILPFEHSKMVKDYLKWKKNKKTYWSSKGS